MATVYIQLHVEEEGALVVCAQRDTQEWQHRVPAKKWRALEQSAHAWTEKFERGLRPLQPPDVLSNLGTDLKEECFAPFYEEMLVGEEGGQIILSSANNACLNLPWELLPVGPDCLGTSSRWTLRRTTQNGPLPLCPLGAGASPLRVLFMACAPVDQKGLDFEREEEAILKLTTKMSDKLHLRIVESGTFEELRQVIKELEPHVVHLSGHGVVKDGTGYICFENERGETDLCTAQEIGRQLFASTSVRLVFLSACQSSQAATAGLCQTLIRDGRVPLALGWAASIADDRATEFAEQFYRDLAAGQEVDEAIASARRTIEVKGRHKQGMEEWQDASFVLPQLYAAHNLNALVDRSLHREPPAMPSVRYELLGDNVRGLREGFVGRRRELQKTRPALRDGDTRVLLLTGIGGAGKSTLTTRLANLFEADGYRVVALRAREEDALGFGLRLVTEVADTCYELNLERHEKTLRDGERPLADRLRLLVKILNEAKILLVLDNLESLLNEPPAAPTWKDETIAAFFETLFSRLTGEGRALLTCRYVPEGFDAKQPQLKHLALPDFTEADFFKYLQRNEEVAERMAKRSTEGGLPRSLLETFQKKLGATPRFLEQACSILQTIGATELQAQLDTIDLEGRNNDPNTLARLQQDYFADLFLPRLFDSLALPARVALSRLALVKSPLPLDGVAQVAGVDEVGAQGYINEWLRFGLVQRFDEIGQVPLYAIYPLQRAFLAASARLNLESAKAAHGAAAAFFQESFQRDRDKELGLSIQAELAACLYHATEADDAERKVWAVLRLCGLLQRQAEFKAALNLAEALLEEAREPELLKQAGDASERLGDWKKARAYYKEALTKHASQDAFVASLWHNLATIDLNEGKYAEARAGFKKSLNIEQFIGDRVGEAATWHQLATIDVYEGNYAEARAGFKKALDIQQAIGDRAGEAAAWHNLASIGVNEGKYVEARAGFKKSLDIKQAIGDRAGEAATWHQLASIDVHEGNYAEARVGFKKALDIRQAIGDRAGEAAAWHELASIDVYEGKYAEARAGFKKALDIRQAIGDRVGEAATFNQIGFMAWENQRHSVGIRLVAISFMLLQAIDAADQNQGWRNLNGMAGELGLDQDGFDTIMEEALESYENDRGAELVRQAFED